MIVGVREFQSTTKSAFLECIFQTLLVSLEFEFDPERVPGGKRAPRVDLSRSVREDTARRSLESVSPHLVEVRGWGEVWWTGDFDVAAARGHLDGSLPAERCMACRGWTRATWQAMEARPTALWMCHCSTDAKRCHKREHST